MSITCRSQGIIPRRFKFESLIRLLHFHLVLPLAFPMHVVCVTGG
jgi:hypothetical protein